MQYNAICIVAGVQKIQVFAFWNFLEFFSPLFQKTFDPQFNWLNLWI